MRGTGEKASQRCPLEFVVDRFHPRQTKFAKKLGGIVQECDLVALQGHPVNTTGPDSQST